jgi:hypothetical protein
MKNTDGTTKKGGNKNTNSDANAAGMKIIIEIN